MRLINSPAVVQTAPARKWGERVPKRNGATVRPAEKHKGARCARLTVTMLLQVTGGDPLIYQSAMVMSFRLGAFPRKQLLPSRFRSDRESE